MPTVRHAEDDAPIAKHHRLKASHDRKEPSLPKEKKKGGGSDHEHESQRRWNGASVWEVSVCPRQFPLDRASGSGVDARDARHCLRGAEHDDSDRGVRETCGSRAYVPPHLPPSPCLTPSRLAPYSVHMSSGGTEAKLGETYRTAAHQRGHGQVRGSVCEVDSGIPSLSVCIGEEWRWRTGRAFDFSSMDTSSGMVSLVRRSSRVSLRRSPAG